MKKNNKVLAVVIAIALVCTLTIPAMAAGTGDITFGDPVRVGNGWGNVKVNFTAQITSNNDNVLVFSGTNYDNDQPWEIRVITNNHGTWDLEATGAIPESGVFFNIYAQYKAPGTNNTKIYSMPVEVYGEGRVSIVDSWGTGSDSINEVRFGQHNTYAPDPDPEIIPEYGSLRLVKAFDGIAASDLPNEWDATFVVTGPDGFEKTYSYSQFVNGEFVIPEDLEPGEYTVEETYSDEIGNGFTFLGVSYSPDGGVITVIENEEAVITITNKYEFSSPSTPPVIVVDNETKLTITKVIDGIDMNLVPDDWSADFEVYVGDSEDPFDTFTLTKNNLTKVYSSDDNANMPVGEYRVVEISGAIDGYTWSTAYSLENGIVMVTEGEDDAALTITNSYSEIKSETPPPTSNPPSREPGPGPGPVNVPSAIVEEVLSAEEFMDIEEEETPLGNYIEEEAAEVEIEEEDVPLSQMPQTGIEDALTLWILALCAALVAAGALIFAVKKASKKDN